MTDILIPILLIVAIFAVSFLVTSGLWILSLCFGFDFSWKLAVGLWIVFLIEQSIFSGGKSK